MLRLHQTLFIIFLVAFSVLSSASAWAGVTVGVGGRVSTPPYRNYSQWWTPFPVINYEGEFAYIRGMSAGVKAIDLDWLEVSALVSYNALSFKAKNTSNSQMSRLDDRHASLLGGGNVRVKTPIGMFHTTIAGDIVDNSNGFTGDLGYLKSFEVEDFSFVPAAGLYWNSSKYNDYYYGISHDEARRSGLERYEAKSSISPYLGLTVNYSINENFSMFVKGETVFLGSEIKDSPMVNKTNIFSISPGVTYSF